jgi:hypothetical protein
VVLLRRPNSVTNQGSWERQHKKTNKETKNKKYRSIGYVMSPIETENGRVSQLYISAWNINLLDKHPLVVGLGIPRICVVEVYNMYRNEIIHTHYVHYQIVYCV